MKVTAIALSVVVPTAVLGNMEQIQHDVAKELRLCKETPADCIKTVQNSVPEPLSEDSIALDIPLDRSLEKEDMGLLANYGCWCYFETDHGSGRGKPIDELDAFCKTLHDGYTCEMMDLQDDGCIPWESTYNSAFGSGLPQQMTMQTLVEECNAENPNDTCGSYTCMVEGWFVQSYFLWSVTGGIINAANRHENGFNPKDSCPISENRTSELGCCGVYPIRFPYKTYGDNRGCCGVKTYNMDTHECCDEEKSSVKMFCPI